VPRLKPEFLDATFFLCAPGGLRYIILKQEDWYKSPSGDDLAAVDVTEFVDWDTDWLAAYVEIFFVTKEVMKNLGPGDEVFMVGMLTDRAGENENLPCARFGAIAMLASETEPVKLSCDP
jgi:hypothetical protein